MLDRKALLGRIVVDSNVKFGKPIVKGTRLTVEHVLGVMASGMSTQEILESYPQLTREDLFACMLFASTMLSDVTYAPSGLSQPTGH